MATKLKLRATARFLSSIFNGVGTTVRKDGLATYVDLDYTQFGAPIGIVDPVNSLILVYNQTTGVFNTAPLNAFIAASSIIKIINAAGPYTALPTDEVLIIKQTTGAAFTVNVDWSARKIPLTVVDGKGDANVNNIIITPKTGQTQMAVANFSYIIDGIGGSITLTPLPDGSGAY